MSDFINKSNWININRGFEYDAAMLFVPKRPLSFFMPKKGDPNTGEITKKLGDFSPISVDGKSKAITQQIIVSVKPRRVVVLSDDKINTDEDLEYVLVAPINTIKEHEKERDWYKLVVSDAHPIYTYLPKGDLDRYIDLSQTVGIHKSLLLKKLRNIGTDRLEVLESDLLQCLSLGIIDEEDHEEDV